MDRTREERQYLDVCGAFGIREKKEINRFTATHSLGEARSRDTLTEIKTYSLIEYGLRGWLIKGEEKYCNFSATASD